jgi:hypothetical protein
MSVYDVRISEISKDFMFRGNAYIVHLTSCIDLAK